MCGKRVCCLYSTAHVVPFCRRRTRSGGPDQVLLSQQLLVIQQVRIIHIDAGPDAGGCRGGRRLHRLGGRLPLDGLLCARLPRRLAPLNLQHGCLACLSACRVVISTAHKMSGQVLHLLELQVKTVQHCNSQGCLSVDGLTHRC